MGRNNPLWSARRDPSRPPVVKGGRKAVERARLSRREALGLLLPLAAAGCGYMVGAPFPEDVRTVAVPIFTSQTFRREVEFQLTEAVQKQIEKQTHFRVADEAYADTKLTGTIVDVRKDNRGETGFDDIRNVGLTFYVQVTWEDLRTGRLLREQQIDIPPDVVALLGQTSFAPELGQSLASATDRVIEQLAYDIVNRMEFPW